MRYNYDGIRFGLLKRRLWLAAATGHGQATGTPPGFHRLTMFCGLEKHSIEEDELKIGSV